MHSSSFDRCREFVESYLHVLPQLRIADVGSCDVNGTYRELFSRPGWEYTGFDLESGPNVNVRLHAPEDWQLESRHVGRYDVVVSGQVLEHVRRPWVWIHQLATLARDDGLIWICAPNTWEFHEFPIDCWRVWPDGLRALFADADIEPLACGFAGPDTVGIGRKRKWAGVPRGRNGSRTDDPAAVSAFRAAAGAAPAVLPQNGSEPAGTRRPSRPPPADLWQRYLQLCAQPSDISEHLPLLYRLAARCDRVMEFGVRDGVSTTALLCAQPARLLAFDIVRSPLVDDLEQLRGSCEFTFQQQHCLLASPEPADLLFIDSFHTAAQLADELARYAKHVRNWIVLHDTTTFGVTGEDGGPGLWSAVEDFLESNPDWFIAVRYHHNHGLTVLQNRGLAIDLLSMLDLFGGPCDYRVFGSHRRRLFLHVNGQVRECSGTTAEDHATDPGRAPVAGPAERMWALCGEELLLFRVDGTECIRVARDVKSGELQGVLLPEEQSAVVVRRIDRSGRCHRRRSDELRAVLTIGSFAQPLWVRANVAAARRFLGADLPILICDDGSSPEQLANLRRIADEYGCRLHQNQIHLGHYGGDLAVLRSAVAWAGKLECRYVFKVSQRTIPVRPGWVYELAGQMADDGSAVAYQTQSTSRQVRTELLGLNVADWNSPVPLAALSEPVTGLLETWFNDVCWRLFPWRHTPIPWLSRSRFRENANVISYYGMGFDPAAALYRELTGREIDAPG